MTRRDGFLLGLMVALSFATACDEEATVGERDAAAPDAATVGDAAGPRADAWVSTPDAGMPDRDAASDVDAAVAVGLAHLEFSLNVLAAGVAPSMPGSTAFLTVSGLDGPLLEGTPVAPTETFGPCTVGGGVIPAAMPGSVDLGVSNVEYEIGTDGRRPLARRLTDGVIDYFSGPITPAPTVGTTVHFFVTLPGHTYTADVVVNGLNMTAPSLTAPRRDYEVVWAPGTDLVVSWVPAGDQHVYLDNLRYNASGMGPSSHVYCVADPGTLSFTIPARIVSTYILNAPGATTDSSMAFFSFDRVVTSDGGVTLGVMRRLRQREAGWPHG